VSQDDEMANGKRLILLLILTASTSAVLGYGFAQGEVPPESAMPGSARLLWLVAVALATVTLAEALAPLVKDSQDRWAKLLRLASQIPSVWCLLATACITSFVVAQVANSQPQPRNYWPLFALWLVAVGSVLVWAFSGVRWSQLRPSALKERLWAYRWELATVTAMTAAAVILRVVNLTSLPTPFSGDEAAFGQRAVSVLDGSDHNMFRSDLHGSPTMYFFAIASFYKVFGVGEFGIRLLSALAGAATIPVLYLLLRQMFDRWVGLLGALYLTGYHFHVHYSRMGLNNIGDVFIIVLTLYFAWRASRSGKTSDFVLTGLTTGFSLYFWQAGKLTPLIVAALFGYTALRRPSFLKENASGMGLALLAYGVSALPLGVFWLTHQNEFLTRMNEMGIFQSGWIDRQQEATGKSTITILWEQAVHAFGGFGRYKDTSPHYLAPISLVDRLSLVPFLLGIAYALYRILEERYFVLLTLFAGSIIAGGVLTVDPPFSPRLLPPIPVVAAMVAIGLKLVADAASRWRPAAGPVVAGVGIAALLATNVHFYFFDYRTGGYYSDYNTRVAEQVVQYVKTLPEDTRLFWYGAPRIYMSGTGHPALTFPIWDRPRFDVLDDGKVVSNPQLPLTGDTPAVFLFLPHREKELQPLLDSCPGGETKTFISKAGRKGLNGIQKTAETSFTAYEVLTPNRCLPLSASASTGG